MSLILKKFDVKEELNAQRQLFKECFPETLETPVSTKEHYLWKFHSKNLNLESSEYGAYSEGALIGYYAAIPYRYKFNKSVLRAAMVCDVMTGQKARGKGVFTKLGVYSTNQFAQNGFAFSTGYPIRKEVIPGHLRAGWEICFELPLFGRFLKFNSYLKQKKLGFIAPLMNTGLFIANLLVVPFRPRKKKYLTTRRYSSDDIDKIKGLETFYQDWSQEIEISLIKDLNFLRWRLSAPEKMYHIITLKDHDKIVGTLIAREVEKEGVPCMGILDICLLERYYKYSSFLIDKLISISKETKVEMFLVMMSNHRFRQFELRNQLFFNSPFKFQFIMKKFDASLDMNIFKDVKKWSLMWIDSDDL